MLLLLCFVCLQTLCSLFALSHMETDLGEFFEDGYLSTQQSSWIRQLSRQLLLQVRPNAVALVDAFNFTDRTLNSAIGNYNGGAYENLLSASRRERLNQTTVSTGYEHFIKPVLKNDFTNWKPASQEILSKL